MSTLRVSNIEAKADPSSPSVNEKVKITNSNGDVMLQLDGATSGITTVGITTTGNTLTVDSYNNVIFSGIVTATSFSGSVSAVMSSTAPSNPSDGNFWWDTNSGELYVYYDDGVSAQWIQANGAETIWDRTGTVIEPTNSGDTLRIGAGTSIYSPASNVLALGTSGSEGLRIGSSGQIGLSGANYGTSGQVLTSQGSGSAPQWATPTTSGNTSIALSTSSSSTSLDGISNSANIVTIGFNNIRVATNDFLAVQLRSGGSNVTGSFYNYGSKLNTSNSGTGAATIYFVVIENNWASNTDRLDGTFTLVRSASNTWVASWTAVTRNNSNAFWGGGDYGAALANLNGIRLLSGVNFVGGEFSLTWS